MRHVFLEGEQIYLRALEERDLSGNYFQWLNDDEVCEFNSHATFPNTEVKMRDYFNSVSNTQNAIVLAIVDKKTDQHIGNISLQRIDWVSRSAEFAILLGEKDFWNKGVSSEAGFLLCSYGFERLNLNRIYCGTSEKNVGMQKLALKLNMVKEGERRAAMFKNGEYCNVYEYGVLKNEFSN
ncbi:MAG: GNAT family N-acetyltransferase [Flavobacteriales bacterium]|nr:GNAT family N-acetyltransferase [Flavobacteriales bacterium]